MVMLHSPAVEIAGACFLKRFASRRIQFLNKRGKFVDAEAISAEEEDNSIVTDENDVDYTEDSFDKFLSNEESNLMKDK